MSTQPGMMAPHPHTYNMIDVKWSWLMTIGVVLLVLGSLAIIFPAATSVSLTIVFGILLIVGGVARLISMFSSTGWGDFLLKMLVAVIYLAVGIFILANPFEGTLTLTLVLGLFFMAQGIVNVLVALVSHAVRGWGWLLFNGFISFILGVLIWTELPDSAAWAIGLLVGIWLIFDGWASIMMGWMKHHEEEDRMAAA